MSESERCPCGAQWSGWVLYIDKTMRRGEDTGWRRMCFRCHRWQWRRRLDWQRPPARAEARPTTTTGDSQ